MSADVFVRRGEYRPGSPGGDALLAHTVQQAGTRSTKAVPKDDGTLIRPTRGDVAKLCQGTAEVSGFKPYLEPKS